MRAKKMATSGASWIAIVALMVAVSAGPRAQQPPAEPGAAPASVQIDGDDIGGVVTSRFGPEAGVWVIAETRDLGTRFAKIAVTDERGRYVIPDLPKAKYQVWVRGYGLVNSAKVDAEPGKLLDLKAEVAPNLADAAQYYPADLLVFDAQDPGQEPLSRHRRQGQRHPREIQDTGAVAQFHQDQWLRQLPSDGQLRDAHHLREARRVRIVVRRLGPSPLGRPGRPRYGPVHHPADDPGRRPSRGARRLDRPHQGGRTAEPQPAAAGRRRAQPRRHSARLARPEALPARPDHDRPAPADCQRLWPDLRRHRTVEQRAAGARPGPQHENDDPAAGPRRHAQARHSPTRSSAPSPYFGMEQTWDSKVNAHTSAMDQDGRVYWAAQNRSPKDIPAYCKQGSPLRSAQLYPLDVAHEGFFQNSRQVRSTIRRPRNSPRSTPASARIT